ncbi:MAG: DsbA family protein [Actinomycetes bacterium]
MAEWSNGIEVFADVSCPFAHVGLQRLVAKRAEMGREDIRFWVRSWPLEIVNGEPRTGEGLRGIVADIREQVAPDSFAAFDAERFPSTLLPAMTLADYAYDQSLDSGERISLELRDLVFEQGVDVSDASVLADLAARYGIEITPAELFDRARMDVDHAAGIQRGVIGSPHFFVGDANFFCPGLVIQRNPGGKNLVEIDTASFDAFAAICFGT